MGVLASDTFVRTAFAGPGFGTSTGGAAWVNRNASTAQSTTGTQGKFTTAITNSNATLGTAADVEGLMRFSLSTALTDSIGLMVRWQALSDHVRFWYDSGNIRIQRRNASVNTNIATAAQTIVLGTNYWIRGRVVGSNYYMRFWQDGNAEPTTWNLTGTDSTAYTTNGFGVNATIGAAANVALFDSVTFNQGYNLAALTQSKFKVATRLQTSTRSTFKVATALLTKAQSTFKIRTVLQSGTRSTFKITTLLLGKAQSTFKIRAQLQARTRSAFKVSAVLISKVRNTFKIRTVLQARTRAKFSIQGALVQFFQVQAKSTFKVLDIAKRIRLTFLSYLGGSYFSSKLIGGSYMSGVFSAMPTISPYSTVQYTLTVSNITGAAEVACNPVTVVVTFPDGTTATYGLGNGVINLGTGSYKLTYLAKGPGIHRETWTLTSGDGVSIGTFANDTPVTY